MLKFPVNCACTFVWNSHDHCTYLPEGTHHTNFFSLKTLLNLKFLNTR